MVTGIAPDDNGAVSWLDDFDHMHGGVWEYTAVTWLSPLHTASATIVYSLFEILTTIFKNFFITLTFRSND